MDTSVICPTVDVGVEGAAVGLVARAVNAKPGGLGAVVHEDIGDTVRVVRNKVGRCRLKDNLIAAVASRRGIRRAVGLIAICVDARDCVRRAGQLEVDDNPIHASRVGKLIPKIESGVAWGTKKHGTAGCADFNHARRA